MLRRWILPCLAVLTLSLTSNVASAHERYYEFDGTHFALSIERFMALDYTDFEGPGGDKAVGRFLLNGSELVPTSIARFGFDVFIRRLSIGLAGGATTEDVGIIAPRVGYMFGLTSQLGLWLRGGGFYASVPGVNYFGLYAEALLGFFPYPNVAITFGPTLDIAFAEDPRPGYVSLGIPQVGMSFWL